MLARKKTKTKKNKHKTKTTTTKNTTKQKDIHAALLLGEPADGGCGHTLNGPPVKLKYSGAIFEMPDCARFRADGSNEITGVEPDILVGFTGTEGPHARAQRFIKKLPDAVVSVRAMAGVSRP